MKRLTWPLSVANRPSLLQSLRQRWLQRRRRRQDAQALVQLDGRELNDLALGRGEVPYWLAQTERNGPCRTDVTTERSQWTA